MADGAAPRSAPRLRGALARLIARPGFQTWAARFPLTRGLVRRDGAAIFHIVQGFVESQALTALVKLEVLDHLTAGPARVATLAHAADLSEDRMQILCQAGAAMGLLKRRRDGRFALARKGAALLGVPGLRQMIEHHGAFYRDMADPVTLLQGQRETELAAFWPYVFGASGAVDPEVTQAYSDLMADSQALVAQDTLAMVPLRGVSHLMDVGGGTGAFLSAVGRAYPGLTMTLVDLPTVLDGARARLDRLGVAGRVMLRPASFRDDALPTGADAISLIRVLYDHEDTTVRALLAKVHAALPPGGRLIVSEPMSGGARPDSVTDVYFAFYTLAMGTGRTRSAARIAELCREAGFSDIQIPRASRPFVTSVVTCVKED
ncbi:acetylserotonin O-methyltransferase [Lutimaribacter sp. EGI FJ00015]|uniref:Acetylserotonin O-methyltransferase n=1 Tax=Lutimaribacter degradans TaxID=2945989 RepID=A0ACC5ZVA0_9RHOB|nr:acetylserotonin O-methyltransferase [Lutimaribacter sp. EGI FJ00013]MCM2562035.1 acetylserotonin O-methyltransferase [Lutimaribacter sp. EGI FJ00013]MCO0612933.1 acetylserotonin O-methyltransferase [Lutimaribacter sp. EGI FJ00015]MCO0635867.1 acetylserotonin O-methyltransferase [Lutimaribacter sp. EGI FJ00014]